MRIKILILFLFSISSFNSFGQELKLKKSDLRLQIEYEKTNDPVTGLIPKEKLLLAKQDAKNKKGKNDVLLSAASGNVFNAAFTNSLAAPLSLNWTERGPYADAVGPSNGNFRANAGITAGRVRAIWPDLADVSGKTVWAAGVDGGLWKTLDITTAPANWVSVDDDQFTNLAIISMAQDPTNTNILYAATGESFMGFAGGAPTSTAVKGVGVYKSIDHGNTWNLLISTANDAFSYCTKVICGSNGYVYLATRMFVNSTNMLTQVGGLRRSKNKGLTWEIITPSKTFMPSHNGFTNYSAGQVSGISDIEISTTGRMHITSGVYRYAQYYAYTDNPENVNATSGWVNATTPFPNYTTNPDYIHRVELAVNGNTLYALPVKQSNLNADTIWKSTDGGANWFFTSGQIPKGTPLTLAQAYYDLAVAINPTNANECIVGGLDNWKTTDGGATWTKISNWFGTTGQYVHADMHNLTWYDNGNKLLFGSDGGVFYSADKGVTIRDRNSGLRIKQFYSTAIHPTAPDYFLAGAQDNGTHQLNSPGLSSSLEILGGDGGFVAIDQTESRFQFGTYLYGGFRRSLDGGSSWSSINFYEGTSTAPINMGQFINPYALDDSTEIIYAGASAGSFFRWDSATINKSGTYYMESNAPNGAAIVSGITNFGGGKVSSVKISPHTLNRVYFGTTTGKIVRIDNANTAVNNPNTINITPAAMSSVSAYASSINIGSSDNNIIACYSNYGISNIWISSNAGQNWTTIDGDLPDMPVRWCMFYPGDDTKAIVATETGVWVTDLINGTSTIWTSNSTFPSVRTDMLAYRSLDRTLLAATHGRGLFSTTLPNLNCTPASSNISAVSTSVCSGTGTTLSLSLPYSSLEYSFQWSSSATSNGTYSNLLTGATQVTGNLTATTYYKCKITCIATGLTFTTSALAVTISNAVTATANAGGPDSVCQSASPGAITLTGSSVGGSATTGAWIIVSGGGSLSTTAQTSAPALVTYIPAANYSGKVTLRLTSNFGSGCGAATSDRTINVNAVLPATVSIASSDADNIICSGSNVIFAASPTNANSPTYQWKLNGNNVGTNSNTYTNTSLKSGEIVHVVMTTLSSACLIGSSIKSNDIQTTVNELPTKPLISSNGITTFCSGDSVGLTASANMTNYLWSTGATTRSISAKTAGIYSVTVRNSFGCTATDSSSLNSLKANIIQRDTTICKGASITLNVDSTTSGISNSLLPSNLRNGLVAYYPFNGNANDESGNGNNGTVNGATLTSDRFGNFTSAFSFNGLTDYIQCKNPGPIGNPQVTVSFWIKTNQIKNAQIIGWGNDAGSGKSYRVYLNAGQRFPTQSITFDTYDNASAYSTLYDNKWDNYIIIYDGTIGFSTSIAKIYRNGVLVTDKIFEVNVAPTNIGIQFPITFGKFHGTVQDLHFKGELDDVAVWNRVLSPSEVNQNFLFQKSAVAAALWSTGATTNSITVTPTQTTKYYVAVSDGITSCKDSITVTVKEPIVFNPFSDTLRVCGDSAILNAGSGYTNYLWSSLPSYKTNNLVPISMRYFYATENKIVDGIKLSYNDNGAIKKLTQFALYAVNNTATSVENSYLDFEYDYKNLPTRYSRFDRLSYNQAIFNNTINSEYSYQNQCRLVSTNTKSVSSNTQSALKYNYNNGELVSVETELTYATFVFNGTSIEALTYNKSDSSLVSFEKRWYDLSIKNPSANITNKPNVELFSTVFQGTFSSFFSLNGCNSKSNIHNNYFETRREIYNGGNILSIRENTPVSINAYGYPTKIKRNFTSYSNGIPQVVIDTFYIDYQPIQGSSSNVLVAKESGKYKVQVNDNSGCSATDSTFVSIVSANIVQQDTSICNGVSKSLDIQCSSIKSCFSAVWSTGAASNSITVTPLQTTQYYVTVFDGITTCRDSVTVTVATIDTSLKALDKPLICKGGGTVRLEAGVGSSYQWIRNGTALIGSNTKIYTATQIGFYRVVVSNAQGCSDTSRSVEIVEEPISKAGVISGPQVVCSPVNKTTFKLSGYFGNIQWQFSADSLSYSSLGGEVKDSLLLFNLQSKIFLRAIVKSGTCSSDTSAVVSIRYVKQSPAFSISSAAQCLDSNRFVFTNSSTASEGTLSYKWDFGDSTYSYAVSPSMSYRRDGSYKVLLTLINSVGCSDTTSKMIKVYPTTTRSSIVLNGKQNICIGDSVLLTGGNYVSYKWYRNDIELKGDTSKTYKPLSSGMYSLRGVSKDGCFGAISDKISLLINPLPSSPLVKDTIYCLGSVAKPLGASISKGHSSLWYKQLSGDTASTTATIPMINALGKTDYYVSQRNDTTGCESPRAKINITVAALPKKPSIKFDGGIFLVDTGHVSYQWIADGKLVSTSSVYFFKPVIAGVYKVKITNINGCSDTSLAYNLVVTAVNNIGTNAGIKMLKVYPNPSKSRVWVDIGGRPMKGAYIKVLDSRGSEVRKIFITQQTTVIEWSGLVSGAYMLEVVNGTSRKTTRVVKE